MHADTLAVTILHNKIILNEVRDNKALVDPLYRGNITDFWANLILQRAIVCVRSVLFLAFFFYF